MLDEEQAQQQRYEAYRRLEIELHRAWQAEHSSGASPEVKGRRSVLSKDLKALTILISSEHSKSGLHVDG